MILLTFDPNLCEPLLYVCIIIVIIIIIIILSFFYWAHQMLRGKINDWLIDYF